MIYDTHVNVLNRQLKNIKSDISIDCDYIHN